MLLPPEWAVQTEGADGGMYSLGDPVSGTQSLLFGVALEREASATVDLFRQEGMQVKEAAPVTLLGSAFGAWEISGQQGGSTMWVRQLAAGQAGGDGRKLVIQYGVFGGGADAVAQAPFERILASLELQGSGPAAAATTAVPAEKKVDQAAPLANAAAETNNPRQQAAELFAQIIQKDDSDLAGIEALYRRVIEEFPQTEQAEESYWRLSNMYLQAFDPPRKADAVALLEQYRQRYPGSKLLDERFPQFAKGFVPLVEERLLQLYEEAGAWPRAEAVYASFLPDAAALTAEKMPFVLGRAKTLEKLGRPGDAAAWYRLYVERSSDPNDFTVGIAKSEMARLSAIAAAPSVGTAAVPGQASPTAAAAAPAGSAPELVAAAKQAQADGDYRGALEKYRASLALQPNPEVEKRVKKLEAYLKIVGGLPQGGN